MPEMGYYFVTTMLPSAQYGRWGTCCGHHHDTVEEAHLCRASLVPVWGESLAVGYECPSLGWCIRAYKPADWQVGCACYPVYVDD